MRAPIVLWATSAFVSGYTVSHGIGIKELAFCRRKEQNHYRLIGRGSLISMLKTASGSADLAAVCVRTAPGPEEIRRQLRNILTSPVFHGSKRCQQFLEYVCEKALSGESGALKERTIAIQVFGRAPESDLGEDTIVRVGAREVRKRLAQYYVTPQGAACEVRIDLPPGAYAPDFHYVRVLHEEEPPHSLTVVTKEIGARRWRSPAALAMAAGCVVLATLAIFAVVKLSSANLNNASFQQSWEPVFRSPDPMLLAVAN